MATHQAAGRLLQLISRNANHWTTHGRAAKPRWFSNGSSTQGPVVDPEAQSSARQRFGRMLAVLLPSSMAAVLAYGFMNPDDQPLFSAASPRQVPVSGESVVNWSATHAAHPKRYYQPENQEDVEAIVADCAATKRKLRVVGSGLSPNGVGFSDEGMMSMALLDKILWINPDTQQVRVEAGCRVQQLADALKPYGLSLQNFASIREQQIGGYTQVSAHGTGATVPPVDEQVVALKLVTPAGGVLELSADRNAELFKLARVGLGCLGVVTEVTLQAVPLQTLHEKTFVASAHKVARNHASWLRNSKHLRYMWLPFTDSVVVVQVNPTGPPAKPSKPQSLQPSNGPATAVAGEQPGASMSAYGDVEQAEQVDERTLAHRLEPLRGLLIKHGGVTHQQIADLSAPELRDALLVLNPLDQPWVKQVNRAEAEFWKRSSGARIGTPDQILGFDCGGQQWVLEVAVPIGRYNRVTSSWRSKSTDLAYMRELLQLIEAADIPAPSPIEQRWTASSSSPMSPAAAGTEGLGADRSKTLPADTVHSWVGIIMYLPTDDAEQRQAITNRFRQYTELVQDKLMPKYNATWHWAKIEVPNDPQRLQNMREALANRFPVAKFNQYRAQLDPDNILGNELVDTLFSKPMPTSGTHGSKA